MYCHHTLGLRTAINKLLDYSHPRFRSVLPRSNSTNPNNYIITTPRGAAFLKKKDALIPKAIILYVGKYLVSFQLPTWQFLHAVRELKLTKQKHML